MCIWDVVALAKRLQRGIPILPGECGNPIVSGFHGLLFGLVVKPVFCGISSPQTAPMEWQVKMRELGVPGV
jgi:polyferredoxin